MEYASTPASQVHSMASALSGRVVPAEISAAKSFSPKAWGMAAFAAIDQNEPITLIDTRFAEAMKMSPAGRSVGPDGPRLAFMIDVSLPTVELEPFLNLMAASADMDAEHGYSIIIGKNALSRR